MRVLDLFSGIGGFSLGLERAGMETVAFCEIEKFPRKVLKKHWPAVPIYNDIRELTFERLQQDGITPIDLVCGGFPCQPFSVAGKRQGTADDRDLWPEMFRVIQEVRPHWVVGENVAGFINMGLERTVTDLEGEGYEVQTFNIPACAVGAPHQRNRVWILAHRTGARAAGRQRFQGNDAVKISGRGGVGGNSHRNAGCKTLAHADQQYAQRVIKKSNGKEIRKIPGKRQVGFSSGEGHWSVEPDVGRVAYGVPARVDRLKGLGNAVVPQIPEIIGRAIMEIENDLQQIPQ